MRLRELAVFMLPLAIYGQNFRTALPGYQYQFPRDHFDHPDFKTEWWYYTGNLHDGAGHRFGFELTFFRQAVPLPNAAAEGVWRPDQLYLAHLALTDIDGGEFYHTERLNRAGPGLAGASLEARKYWNGNWQVAWTNLTTGEQQLQAVCDRFTLTLTLLPQKPLVIHGQNGVSQKGPAAGDASHYISFTRLAAQGQLRRSSSPETVSGVAWMDHEFFTSQASDSLAGWDWFAVQLDNNEELMLYRLRTKSGAISPFSSGTYIDAAGGAHFLSSGQFTLAPGRMWGKYPLEWTITAPSLGLQLSEQTPLDSQELATANSPSPRYWEGAVIFSGILRGKTVHGMGYLELTGYREPLRLGH